MTTITLSVEPQEGPAFQHGFHLGTDIRIAERLAEELFHSYNAKTVALKRNGGILDVFDGMAWDTDRIADMFDKG